MTTPLKHACDVKPNDIIVTPYGEKIKVTQVILCADGTVILSLENHSPCLYAKYETVAVVI